MDLVLFDVRGGIGRITLNRPRAINALNHEMISAVYGQLLAWLDDDAVATVLIDGAGERGLCAGGDVRQVAESARGDGELARSLWRTEYRMNALIGSYPKPVCALMHGVVLGGGVGISAHAAHRLVTENTAIGMPEVTIGLVPDVGGSWLLSHAPGELGTKLALTGASMGPADAIACGWADACLSADGLAAVRAAVDSTALFAAVTAGSIDPGPSPLVAQREWIDQCCSGDSAVDIVAALRAHPAAEAQAAAEVMLAKCPTAVQVTLTALRRARTLPSLERALELEYRIMSRRIGAADLLEGVRAQLIDKDRDPHWRPATLAEVDADEVARHFADLGAAELVLG